MAKPSKKVPVDTLPTKKKKPVPVDTVRLKKRVSADYKDGHSLMHQSEQSLRDANHRSKLYGLGADRLSTARARADTLHGARQGKIPVNAARSNKSAVIDDTSARRKKGKGRKPAAQSTAIRGAMGLR